VGEEENFLPKKRNPILVYPNPNNGSFTLATELDIVTIEIYNIQGQLVQRINPVKGSNQQNIQLNSSNKEGMYILRAISSEGEAFNNRILLIP
jgi:hypothetical protein